MVIYLTGLSGAGKSTIAEALADRVRQFYINTVVVDGEVVRNILKCNTAFSQTERKEIASCYCRMAEWLEAQGSVVICATISNFPDLRQWNRDNLQEYFEVFVDVPVDIIEQERDCKGYYAKHKQGLISNMIGLDIPFIVPKDADLRIDNSTVRECFDDCVDDILNGIHKKYGMFGDLVHRDEDCVNMGEGRCQ